MLQTENTFEANLKVGCFEQFNVLGSAEASFALELEGRAISERRGKSENCCSYQQSCQINCSAECELTFARRSRQYFSSHVEVLFNGSKCLQTYALSCLIENI